MRTPCIVAGLRTVGKDLCLNNGLINRWAGLSSPTRAQYTKYQLAEIKRLLRAIWVGLAVHFRLRIVVMATKARPSLSSSLQTSLADFGLRFPSWDLPSRCFSSRSSLTPSLLPRHFVVQGMLTGISRWPSVTVLACFVFGSGNTLN